MPTKQRFVPVRMQNKFDTEANWRANDPVLLRGELALSVPGNTVENITDGVIHIKVGDGIHKWSELAYGAMGMMGPTGSAGPTGPTGPRGVKGDRGAEGQRGAQGIGIKSISSSVSEEGDNQKVTLTITKDDDTYTNTNFNVPKGVPGQAGNAGRSMWNATVVIDKEASAVSKSFITPLDANILVNDTIVDAKGQTFLATANAAPAAVEVKIKFTSDWGSGKVDQDSYDEDKSADDEWKNTAGQEIDFHDRWIKVTGSPILIDWPTTGPLIHIFGHPEIIAKPITGIIGNSGWNPSGVFATLKDRFDDLESIRKGDFELVTTGSTGTVFKPIKNVFADKDQFTAFVTGSNTNFDNIKKGTFEVEFDSGVKAQLGQTIKDKLDKSDKNTFNTLLTGATGFKNLDVKIGTKIGADEVPPILASELDKEGSAANTAIGKRFVLQTTLSGTLTGYATKTDIKPFITGGALDGYATQNWVSGRGFLTGSALSGYAKEEWVNGRGFLTGSALNEYATKTDIEPFITGGALVGYAKEEWVNSKGFLTGSALNGYATQSWVNGKGFLTGNALNGYATQSWVNNKGFLTTGALQAYPSKEWVNQNFTPTNTFLEVKNKADTAAIDISNIKIAVGSSSDAAGSSSLFGQFKNVSSLASSASSKADTASSTASNALSQATSAINKANSANSAASSAATKADQANTAANSVVTKVNEISSGISNGSLAVSASGNSKTLAEILNGTKNSIVNLNNTINATKNSKRYLHQVYAQGGAINAWPSFRIGFTIPSNRSTSYTNIHQVEDDLKQLKTINSSGKTVGAIIPASGILRDNDDLVKQILSIYYEFNDDHPAWEKGRLDAVDISFTYSNGSYTGSSMIHTSSLENLSTIYYNTVTFYDIVIPLQDDDAVNALTTVSF